MKQLTVVFSLILIIALVMALPQSSVAQDDEIRKSLRASVTQTIGVDTDVTFDWPSRCKRTHNLG